MTFRRGYFAVMALGHSAAGRPEDAVEWAQRSIQRRPDYVTSHLVLAGCCAVLGRLDEARTAVAEILRLNPEFSLSGVNLFLSGSDPAFVELATNSLRKAGLPE